MKRYVFGAVLPILSVALSGCATVVNGTSQNFSIETNPQGATAHLSNGIDCETPCHMSLKRRDEFSATIKAKGYKPATVTVHSKAGGAIAGNILLGGVIGVAVDASNGANRFLSPNPLRLKLVEEGGVGEAALLDKDGKVTGTVLASTLDTAVAAKGEVAEPAKPVTAASQDAPAGAAPPAATPIGTASGN